MTDYDSRQDRNPVSQPDRDVRELPVDISRQVIQAAVQSSMAMQLCRVSPMASRQGSQPVLTEYPEAFWLTGANQAAKDSASKKTTKVSWDQYTWQAEELAVLYPIPDAYVFDTGIDLFNEIKPALGMAFGRKIDNAVFYGVDSPFTYDGIVPQTLANGNYVVAGAATDPATGNPQDLASDIADMGIQLEEDGYELGGFAGGPGLKWRLSKLRSTTGEPIYQGANPGIGQSAALYGETFATVKNGVWDPTQATLLAGDWEFARIGVRQDLTFQVFDSGVISDPDTGAVVYNAMQQDGKILRAVMRVAWLLVPPKITPVNEIDPWPFSALVPSAPAS